MVFDVRHVDGRPSGAARRGYRYRRATCAFATKVDAEVFAAAPRLKVVARAGVGLDNVDVQPQLNVVFLVVTPHVEHCFRGGHAHCVTACGCPASTCRGSSFGMGSGTHLVFGY